MSILIMSSVFSPSLEHTNARYRPDRVEVATEKTLFSGTRKFGIGQDCCRTLHDLLRPKAETSFVDFAL